MHIYDSLHGGNEKLWMREKEREEREREKETEIGKEP